jgi:biopolymer transport protein TolR
MDQSAALTAAQRGRIRRLSAPKELAPDEEGGELNIVPFLDIIMNILIFVLATVAVTFTASIESTPPSLGGGVRSDIKSNALNLTILVVNDGFSLKASGGNVAPGCQGVGSGIAIPKVSGRYDYKALNECAKRLKDSNPDFADERQVTISPNPATPYSDLVNVIDAVRETQGGATLFDDVKFGVVR